MTRPVWTGTVTIGLLTIATRATRATSPHSIETHTYDRRTGARIKNQQVNADTGQPVPPEEIERGTEHAGHLVYLPAGTLPTAPAAGKVLALDGFADPATIDPRGYGTVYDLTPDPKTPGAAVAFSLLAAAMHETGTAGHGTWHYRGAARLAIIHADGPGITLAEYAWPDELRPAPAEPATVDPAQVATAVQLIEAMRAPWSHEEHPDEIHAAQLATIEALAAGRPPLAAVPDLPTDPAGDLMAQLIASVEASRRTA